MNLKDIKKLDVFYGNKRVGYLLENPDLTHSFVYSKDWIKTGFSISPFKLPLEEKEFLCNDPLIQNMFGVFYDCLPDSWGNHLIDRYLSQNGFNPSKVTLLQRLSLLDKYSIGGLSFKPSINDVFSISDKENFDNLFDKIQAFLKNDSKLDFDLYHYGSSTGGSRPKINHFFEDGFYIVKFPGPQDSIDIGKQEYELNMLAKECGFDVPECKLINSNNCPGFFASKRFDYENGTKRHVISLAGLFDLNPFLSQIHYLGFLQTVKSLCPNDLNEAVGRMIFNYLVGNKDDHPRNFSFVFCEKEKKYRLAPFYDITSIPSIEEHMMMVNDTSNPSLEDFIFVASKVGVSKQETIDIYNNLKDKIDRFFSKHK